MTVLDTTLQIGVRELRENLSAYMRRVQGGAVIHVMSRDDVVAELRPPSPEVQAPRRPGALRGKIRMAADFDQTPDDLIDAMEGSA